jgi:hypothetical protein
VRKSLILDKLVQDSPSKIFVPQETIYVGEFACQLNPCLEYSSDHVQSSNLERTEDVIPVKVVFDRLKGQLPQNKQVNCSSGAQLVMMTLKP